MSSHRLIVETAAQTRRRRIAIAVLGAVLLVAGWGLYMLGRMQAPGGAHYQVARKTSEVGQEQLRAENRRLQAANDRLSERLTTFERSAEVDRTATSELRDSLEQMQARVAELKKELAFYRGIVSPEGGEGGLRVQDLSVERADEEAIYNLHLTLIQAMRHESDVSGRVRMQLHGVRDGESASLAWSDMALDSAAELVFSFKYFQDLGGAFRLPDGLEPTRIEVSVDSDASDSDAVTKTYRWQELTKADG